MANCAARLRRLEGQLRPGDPMQAKHPAEEWQAFLARLGVTAALPPGSMTLRDMAAHLSDDDLRLAIDALDARKAGLEGITPC